MKPDELRRPAIAFGLVAVAAAVTGEVVRHHAAPATAAAGIAPTGPAPAGN